MLKDEIRQQTVKMKDMTLSQKASYIWDYYKIPILATLFLIFLTAFFINERMHHKDVVLNVVMLGSNVEGPVSDTFLEGLADALPSYDPEKETLTVNADYDLNGTDQFSLTYRQKLMAEYSIGAVDATIGSEEDIKMLADFQAFGDLRTILPEDLYSYLESSGIRIINARYEDPSTGKIYDFPAAVDISSSPVLSKGFDDYEGQHREYYDTPCFLGISPNTEHPENSIVLLKYLLDIK